MVDGRTYYAGFTNLPLVETYELGNGLVLEPTYAHIMIPVVAAFARPASPNTHHPGPWRTSDGWTLDITAQLRVPIEFAPRQKDRTLIARAMTFLLRTYADPAIALGAIGSIAFAQMPSAPDGTEFIYGIEVAPRSFPLQSDNVDALRAMPAVIANWPTVYELYSSSAEFRLAADALSSGQYLHNDALALVSMWAALEAIFSPSTSELRFRVSACIASYLEPPGRSRLQMQATVMKLYDRRSSAAHGKSKHTPADLIATFNLLRNVLMRIVQMKSVPTHEELNRYLFLDLGK